MTRLTQSGRYGCLRCYSAGMKRAARISLRDCRKIWIEEVRNRLAIIAATNRSGHLVAVPQTAKAAIMTAIFPMASLREHNQTERTLASPSLYRIRIRTLAALATKARIPIAP